MQVTGNDCTRETKTRPNKPFSSPARVNWRLFLMSLFSSFCPFYEHLLYISYLPFIFAVPLMGPIHTRWFLGSCLLTVSAMLYIYIYMYVCVFVFVVLMKQSTCKHYRSLRSCFCQWASRQKWQANRDDRSPKAWQENNRNWPDQIAWTITGKTS